MDQYQTQTGSRPDLEAIEVNAPESYIGHLIYPRLDMAESSGTIRYQTLIADAAAQTGRSAGTAPTATYIADASTTFAAAALEKRYAIERKNVKQMGGIEAADRLGGLASKRSVCNALEDAQAAAFFDASSYSGAEDISGQFFWKIAEALRSIKRYKGESALVLSPGVQHFLIQQSEVTDRLAYTGFNFGNPSAVLSMTDEVIKSMLQGVFQVQHVLIGDEDRWGISGQEDALGVTKLPDAFDLSHHMDPVLGKTVHYLPDGKEYTVESYYDKDLKSNIYDAETQYQVKELNAAAKVIMTLGSLSTTTTTA